MAYPPPTAQPRTPASRWAVSARHALIPVCQVRAYAEPPTPADTHPRDAPCESRDGVALANRKRRDHIGLEWLTAIEGAAVPDGYSAPPRGHTSLPDLQLFHAQAR